MKDLFQESYDKIIDAARNNPITALELSNIIVEKYPNDSRSWLSRSYANSMIPKYLDAIDDIEMAISINPNEPHYFYNLGQYLIKEKKFEEACISFSKLINLGEINNFYYYEDSALFFRAFCYCRLGLYRDAEADLRKVRNQEQEWIDRLRTKEDLLEACRAGRLE